ncbi:MAG: TlpA family protein disulfide reductase, partial [Chitinophagaceae bacterium]|nr:TlpA family protein disulfide reductase [Chitinophagaceae bacterium]
FAATSVFGKVYKSEMLTGKTTFVNFWFRNCAPCIAELKSLNQLYSDNKLNPNFLMISFTYEDDNTVKQFIEEYNIQYDIISLSRDECKRLNFSNGYPTNFIYDKNSRITFMKVGGSINERDVEKEFKELVLPALKKEISK